MPSSLPTTIRDLHLRRGRERRRLTLAEGIRLIEEALSSRAEIEAAVIAPSLEHTPRGAALIESLGSAGIRIERVSDKELEALAETEQSQGIIAVVKLPEWSPANLDLAGRKAVIVLDGVQDPGNAGTILRTALGLGAAGMIALPGSVEIANPKVVRGSMGAAFRLPVLAIGHDELLGWLRQESVELLVAEVGGAPIQSIKPVGPVALVLGNEGAGVSPALKSAGRAVGIALPGGAESLNVAVAAGILLYEVMRER